MQERLLNDISTRVVLTETDKKLLEQYFEPINYPKNYLIEEAGRPPQYMYYILSGYMRLFHYDDSGDEVTTHINCYHRFFTSYNSFINNRVSNDNIETITECELLRISRENLDILLSESPSMKDFSIHALQESIRYNENRSKKLITLTAEERYRDLIKNDPNVILNVPLQYIASFLGMKPGSLSRIRKNIII